MSPLYPATESSTTRPAIRIRPASGLWTNEQAFILDVEALKHDFAMDSLLARQDHDVAKLETKARHQQDSDSLNHRWHVVTTLVYKLAAAVTMHYVRHQYTFVVLRCRSQT